METHRLILTGLFTTRYIYISKDILQQRNKYSVILCNTVNVLHTHFPFYTTQIITPFLNSNISAKHEEVDGKQFMVNPHSPYCLSIVKFFSSHFLRCFGNIQIIPFFRRVRASLQFEINLK